MYQFAILATALLFSSEAHQAAPRDNTVDPAIVEAPKRWPGVIPTDQQIENQLRAALKAQPDKVICLRITRTGSYLPHESCRTLLGWYEFEADRNTEGHTRDIVAQLDEMPQGGDEVGARLFRPPHELVEMVKDRYRSPTARARALERARIRMNEARRPQTEPSISHP